MLSHLMSVTVAALMALNLACAAGIKGKVTKPLPVGLDCSSPEARNDPKCPNVQKSDAAAMQITDRAPFVMRAGETLTLTGANLRPTLVLERLAMGPPAGERLHAETLSDTRATFVVPNDVAAGPLELTAEQDGVTQKLSIFIDGGKTDFPVFTGDAAAICSGDKFYDASGALRQGAKTCANSSGTCTADGQVACQTTADYAAAATAGLAAIVRVGQTVAGVAGTLDPAPADCAADGAVGCVAVATFPAVDKVGKLHAANILAGVTIAGVSGAVEPRPADCANDGEVGCVATASYKAAKMSNFSAIQVVNGTSIAGVAGALSFCSADGATACVAVTAFPAAKLANFTSGDVRATVHIAGITGVLSGAPVSCAIDGDTGCLANSSYKAAAVTGLADKVLNGRTVAGVAGDVTLPAVGNVLAGSQFGVLGTGLTGTLTLPGAAQVRVASGGYGVAGTGTTPTLADCAVDGGTVCVAVASYTAAATAGLADKILGTATVAGVTGNVTLPAVGKVLTGVHFGVSGGSLTGTLTLPVGSNVLAGSGAYGEPGATVTPAFSPDYPAADKVLNGATVNGASGTLTLPAVGKVMTGTAYGVGGNGSTGTLTMPSAGNVLAGGGTFGDPGAAVTPTLTLPAAGNVLASAGAFGVAGTGTTPTLTLPSAGNVLAGAGAFGVAGTGTTPTLTLPVAGDVYTGIQYGAAGTGASGTLTLAAAANVRTGNGAFGRGGASVTPTLGDCASDGGTACVAVAGYPSAKLDPGNLDAANIKRGVAIGGVTGAFPSATNPLPRYSDTGATASTNADGGITTGFTTFTTQLTTDGSFEFWDSSGVRRTGSGDSDATAGNVKKDVALENLGITGSAYIPDVWDVRAGTSVGSTTGKLKVNCRNAAKLASWDIAMPMSAVVDSAVDTLTVTGHGLASNDRVRVSYSSAAVPGGLTLAGIYYVIVTNANTIQLSSASGPGAAIDITSDGAEVAVYRWADGALGTADTIDDYNVGGSVLTASPWNSDNFCTGVEAAAGDANVWKDVTTGGCDATKCRYKDKISGLEWTKTQSTSLSWGAAMSLCNTLTFDAVTGWRLPTQKELTDAASHGIRSAFTANWIPSTQNLSNFWSSTALTAVGGPTFVAKSLLVSFQFGSVGSATWNTSEYVACVR